MAMMITVNELVDRYRATANRAAFRDMVATLYAEEFISKDAYDRFCFNRDLIDGIEF